MIPPAGRVGFPEKPPGLAPVKGWKTKRWLGASGSGPGTRRLGRTFRGRPETVNSDFPSPHGVADAPMLRKPHKFRVILLGGIFVVLGAAVAARLVALQVVSHDRYSARARGQHVTEVVLQSERGDILDRRGRPLATSTGTLSIYIDRAHFAPEGSGIDKERIAGQLAWFLQQSPARVLSRIEGERGVVTLGRQLDPVTAERIGDLFRQWSVPRRAYWFHRESKRLYPRGIAPHIVGYTATDGDGDNEGLAGLELMYNRHLSGQRIESASFRTGLSQVIMPFEQGALLDARGRTLVLTIDAAIQEAAESAIAAAAEEFRARGAGAIAMDAQTGEILAMAAWPTFDNSRHGAATNDARRNRLLTDPFEPGSVAKLWTAAMLLDLGLVHPDEIFDCEGGTAVVDGRRLRDSGSRLRRVTFREVIRHSSNVGAVKAGIRMDNETWHGYLRAFGFGQPTGIDLPGEGSGLLYPTSRWTRLSRTSLPMGYEIGVTPMQTVVAVAALANGGEVLRPFVVKEIRDSRGAVVERRERHVVRRVIRPSTSAQMRELMADVVINGTGRPAAVEGYQVGGKTGTTRKSHIHDRAEYIASFAGVIPTDHPRVAIYVYVDDPQGSYYASRVAAPAFREIARAAMLHLDVTPTTPREPAADHAGAATRGFADWQPVEAGEMPDLRGLSLAGVRAELSRLGASDIRILGSGRVVDQQPQPGAPFDAAHTVIVVLDPSGERRPVPAATLSTAWSTPAP